MTTRGYHGCMAVACKSGARKTVPLDLKIWSSLAEGHKGEPQPSPALRRRHDDQDVRQRLRAGRLLANVAAKPFRRRLDKRSPHIKILGPAFHPWPFSPLLPACTQARNAGFHRGCNSIAHFAAHGHPATSSRSETLVRSVRQPDGAKGKSPSTADQRPEAGWTNALNSKPRRRIAPFATHWPVTASR